MDVIKEGMLASAKVAEAAARLGERLFGEKQKFNSQICTTREQSGRLLSLGLKKETADCYLFEQDGETSIVAKPYSEIEKQLEGLPHDCAIYPAWSLHRLLYLYGLEVTIIEIFKNEGETYDCVISGIEIAIKEGYFNKEYLENGND